MLSFLKEIFLGCIQTRSQLRNHQLLQCIKCREPRKNRSSFYFSSVSSSNLKLNQNRTKKTYSNRELFLKRGNTKPSSCTCQLYQKQYFEKRLRMASVQFLSFQKWLMVTACRNKKHYQKTVHIRNYLLCSKTF